MARSPEVGDLQHRNIPESVLQDSVAVEYIFVDNGTQTAGDSQSRFQVSGVAQVGDWMRSSRPGISMPSDTDVVFVGRPPPKNREEVLHVPVVPWRLGLESVELQQYCYNYCPLATQVHARCWDLAQRVFGSSFIEQDMDIWLEAARQQFHAFVNHAPESESNQYSNALMRLHIINREIIDDFRHNPLKYAQESVDRYIQEIGYNLPHDPINISELRDLIDKAIEIEREDKAEEVCPAGVGLPPEVKMMILDCLDTMDIRNSLSVFHWRLPSGYWCTRFAKEIVFEYEDLENTNLNWGYLCLGVADLLETSHGLRHRKRTLGNLNEIKKIFEEKKKQKRQSDGGL
ncbi:hypothetical protein MW887_007656 [Aspergillus wentii]|nr:hypothetical protein MW887_007656 [Aspergillus wentii]